MKADQDMRRFGACPDRPRSLMHELEFEHLAWCDVNGRLVFLDTARDRYFMLPAKRDRVVRQRLAEKGRASWHQPTALPRPASWCLPRRASSAIDAGAFRLGRVAAAIWIQRRIEQRLARRSFAEVLGEYLLIKQRRSRNGRIRHSHEAVIAAFEQARLLRSSADRCLPRSIALALSLTSPEYHVHVVIGVRQAPFSAHCWVQKGDEVLSDSVEEVLRFTPILVV